VKRNGAFCRELETFFSLNTYVVFLPSRLCYVWFGKKRMEVKQNKREREKEKKKKSEREFFRSHRTYTGKQSKVKKRNSNEEEKENVANIDNAFLFFFHSVVTRQVYCSIVEREFYNMFVVTFVSSSMPPSSQLA